MSAGPVRRVVVLGGGTAGWMTAAALSRLIVPGGGVSVTLVESDDIGTVGVGEATIPSILDFLAMLEVDEDAFVRATGATFKLGIAFADWRRVGESYIHPFGSFGRDALGVPFHQMWLRRLRQGAAPGSLTDYCLCAAAAARGRFTRPEGAPGSVLRSLRYAFHFDASLVAAFLRRYAEAAGVVRIEGRVEGAELASATGHVAAIRLADGRRVEGDLFADCSGFRSLLLGDALGVPFEGWERWLPNDRALAVPSEASAAPPPFTLATAGPAGWRWRIPLQHRTGNGHVYSSQHLSDAEAERQLMAGLGEAAVGPVRPIRFAAGMRARLWEGNCVAIGLSGGFLEPLESTSIHLIQAGIARLMGLFPDRDFAAPERDEYNRLMRREYEHARDFVILHYKATERDDTDYWRQCRAMDVPTTLADRIELWRTRARVVHDRGELFTPDSWVAVLAGQGPRPRGHDPLADAMPADGVDRFLAHARDAVARTADAMPAHADFIARTCAAPFARPA